MEEQEKIKAIEDLLGGELSPAEEKQLRASLANDPEMQALLTHEEELLAGIKHWSRSELRARLRELESSLEPIEVSTEEKKKTNWRPLLAAATVTLLVGLYFIFNTAQTSPDALYEQYYEPYESYAAAVRRGGEAPSGDQLYQALQAYENKDYEKAVEQLEAMAPGEERDFYLAHSYLAIGEHQKALPLLEQLAETGAEPRSTVSWYLALAYLKNGDTPQANEIFKELAAYDNAYQKKASELLEDLK